MKPVSNAIRVGVCAIQGMEWMGGTMYTRSTCQALQSMGKDRVEVVLLADQTLASSTPWDCADEVQWLTHPGLRNVVMPSIGADRARARLQLEWEARKHGLDCLLLAQLGPAASVRWVGWIPDFMHEELPEFFTPHAIQWRRNTLADMVSGADWLMVPSKHAASIVGQLYPRVAQRLTVVRLAHLPDARIYERKPKETLERYGIPERFLYLPNQFLAHKNHRVILEAYRRLGAQAPMLVCTGILHDPNNFPAAGDVLRDHWAAVSCGQVRLLGVLPRAEQMDLYRACMAVVNPSLYEGWSASIEEARSIGKPCVLSGIPSFKEQAPPSSVFFDPLDPEDAVRALLEAQEKFPPGVDLSAELTARSEAEVRFYEYAQALYRAVDFAVQSEPPLWRTVRVALRSTTQTPVNKG